MHMVCPSGRDRPIFRNYGALADQNGSVTKALKLALYMTRQLILVPTIWTARTAQQLFPNT